MGPVNPGFKHGLATRASESQKPWQEVPRRLLLGLITPESVRLFALRTVERDGQR
jgi:hypothetical protein